ncbi:hypothetical protein [Amycolatopsis sp. CA-128772]|uniref:hypothetical protein n=1 Tax=Amycolatopsis sp. CA-128772 TaxID=2073159 RepID=UPI001E52A0BB|nr:hypothetical protein [Amycolatopsis sp. CA-128772]
MTGKKPVPAGRYRLLGTTGRGPGGTLWRAHDERLDRPVTVRRLPPGCPLDAAHSDRARARAIREARAAIRLRHPHTLVVHDVFEHELTPNVVTGHLAARTLADLVAQDGPCARTGLPPSAPSSRRRTPTACCTAGSAPGTC